MFDEIELNFMGLNKILSVFILNKNEIKLKIFF